MRTFKAHLEEKLEDPQFQQFFDEETEFVRMGLEVAEARERLGISQAELARRARVTQQQVSKIEHGINCNVLTLLKVCRVLSLVCRLNTAT